MSITLALILLASTPAAPGSPAPTVAAAPAAVPAKLADLGWMVGRWRGTEAGPDATEEIWGVAEGNTMIGTWRWVQNGKARLFEFLTLTEEEGGVVLRFRHFDAKLVGWEEKDCPLTLPVVSVRDGEVVFAGRDRDGGPLRLTYRREGAEGLHATLEKANGKQDYPMRRAR